MDIRYIPPMSDEPERIFSLAGLLLDDRRLRMAVEVMEARKLLAHWDGQGLIVMGAPMNASEEVSSVGNDEDTREVNGELPTLGATQVSFSAVLSEDFGNL
ncbi:uncharacterized protein K441DRAFT_653519 [Cenococcum geophilum 1.58]|uniref:uncharacterized protein n=1 Tax=Cenococcum geophilum 1.58 TaxID=794803 RepID=UPI00358ECDD9|nr:hypothetical protein K441DRAFT_653519 [Cenococcum geophilum 1.58]